MMDGILYSYDSEMNNYNVKCSADSGVHCLNFFFLIFELSVS